MDGGKLFTIEKRRYIISRQITDLLFFGPYVWKIGRGEGVWTKFYDVAVGRQTVNQRATNKAITGSD
jgi:hypothetical protein